MSAVTGGSSARSGEVGSESDSEPNRNTIAVKPGSTILLNHKIKYTKFVRLGVSIRSFFVFWLI
jgi:hypothetical protein